VLVVGKHSPEVELKKRNGGKGKRRWVTKTTAAQYAFLLLQDRLLKDAGTFTIGSVRKLPDKFSMRMPISSLA